MLFTLHAKIQYICLCLFCLFNNYSLHISHCQSIFNWIFGRYFYFFFNFWGFFLSFKNRFNWPAADSCSHFLQNSRGLGIFFFISKFGSLPWAKHLRNVFREFLSEFLSYFCQLGECFLQITQMDWLRPFAIRLNSPSVSNFPF